MDEFLDLIRALCWILELILVELIKALLEPHETTHIYHRLELVELLKLGAGGELQQPKHLLERRHQLAACLGQPLRRECLRVRSGGGDLASVAHDINSVPELL